MRIGTLRTLDEIKAVVATGDSLDDDNIKKVVAALCDIVAQQQAELRRTVFDLIQPF